MHSGLNIIRIICYVIIIKIVNGKITHLLENQQFIKKG